MIVYLNKNEELKTSDDGNKTIQILGEYWPPELTTWSITRHIKILIPYLD